MWIKSGHRVFRGLIAERTPRLQASILGIKHAERSKQADKSTVTIKLILIHLN